MTKLRLTEWKQIAQSSYYLAELRLKARVSHSRRFHYTTLTFSFALSLFLHPVCPTAATVLKGASLLFLHKHIWPHKQGSQLVTSHTDLPLLVTDGLSIFTWFGTILNITHSLPRSQWLETAIESLHHFRVVLMEVFPFSSISKFCFFSLIHWHDNVFVWI